MVDIYVPLTLLKMSNVWNVSVGCIVRWNIVTLFWTIQYAAFLVKNGRYEKAFYGGEDPTYNRV